MAYGKIKADAIIRDNSGSDEEITMATIVGLDSNKASLTGATFTGDVILSAQNDLKFRGSSGSNFIGFQAPGTVSTSSLWTLPADAPTADQVLTVTSVSSNNPTLEWADAASGKLGKVTCLESNTRTSVSVTPSGSAFTVVNILGMGNFTKATDTSALYIWGMSQGHGQQSGGGGFTIQVGSTVIDQAGHFTYPGGNYAVGVSWAAKVAAGGMNAGTYAITLGHRSNASNKPISILNPDSSSNDHNAYPPTGNNGTGTVIFVMEVEP